MYPYIIHRAYQCGHPDDFIEVDEEILNAKPQRLRHTLIPPPLHKTGDGMKRPYQQSLERCRDCAMKHQNRKSRQNPGVRMRRLAANQGEVQGGEEWVKDGFLHVLLRQRFGRIPKEPVQWADEGPQDLLFQDLRSLNEKVFAERGVMPHMRIPIRERTETRAVDGPGGMVYVIEECVHPDVLSHPHYRETFIPTALQSDSTELLTSSPQSGYLEPLSTSSPASVYKSSAHASLEEVSQGSAPVSTPSPRPSVDSWYSWLSGKSEEGVTRSQTLPMQHQGGYGRGAVSPLRHSAGLLQATHARDYTGFDSPRQAPQPPSHLGYNQRPWGPTRESGGTTLSLGDEPSSSNLANRVNTVRGRGATLSSGSYRDRLKENLNLPSPRGANRASDSSMRSDGSAGRGSGNPKRASYGSTHSDWSTQSSESRRAMLNLDKPLPPRPR